MVFHHNQKQVQYPNIKINNIEINRVSQLIFLFSDNSECRPKMEKNHIDHISMKISKVIGIMYRLKCILYHKTMLLTLHNSLIVPLLIIVYSPGVPKL